MLISKKISDVKKQRYVEEGKSKEEGFIESFSVFFESVIKKPIYFLPISILSLIAYLPSLTNTKRQFEDFHVDYYFGSGMQTLSGRWGMYLWANLMGNAGNDILNKFFGVCFLMAASIMISAVFYYLTDHRTCIMKYTVLSSTVCTFPLLNEIWSYNIANSLVGLNLFIISFSVYFLLTSNLELVKRVIIISFPFVFVSSSYESGLFAYITLACVILFYRLLNNKICLIECVKFGTVFAIPLIVGIIIGYLIGKINTIIWGLSYHRHGATTLQWGESNALKIMLAQNFEHYFLRGLVYLPILVFDIAVGVFFLMICFYVFKKRWDVVLGAIVVFISIFILSVYQGSFLPYRTAQSVTVFTGFVFFLLMEMSERWKKHIRIAITTILIILCVEQSAYLEKINLIDYQNAHNDEDLMRQIGYELTTDYYGKPVLFVGHIYDGYTLYSGEIMKNITIDANTWNGELYNRLIDKLNIERKNDKLFDSNMWSVIFLAVAEESSMEQFFSYCGYSIDVLSNANIAGEYPEVQKMIDNEELHTLQYIDMGDYVVVGL